MLLHLIPYFSVNFRIKLLIMSHFNAHKTTRYMCICISIIIMTWVENIPIHLKLWQGIWRMITETFKMRHQTKLNSKKCWRNIVWYFNIVVKGEITGRKAHHQKKNQESVNQYFLHIWCRIWLKSQSFKSLVLKASVCLHKIN